LKAPRILGVHADPGRWLSIGLAALPFVLLAVVYTTASSARLAENEADKLLPSFSQMADAFARMAFEPDKRTEEYLLWADTLASLRRLLSGIGLASLCGFWIGLNMGVFPGLASLARPAITFLSIVPPLALLPILFIALGAEELAKIALIFIGIVFVVARDTLLAVRALPVEQIIKALTLGASQLAVVYRIVMPQVLPRLLETVRLSLGAGWLFLIAAEAIAATEGLGYRIFLARRYLSMDVIIPYVLWITLLGFVLDFMLRKLLSWRFAWYEART